MRIAIVGSRDFESLILVHNFVYTLPVDTVIVSGGAEGVDITAQEAAIKRNFPPSLIFKPDWRPNGVYNPGAGHERNQQIIDAADMVVAFWNGTSTGTYDSISRATTEKKPLIIIDEYGMIFLSKPLNPKRKKG